MNYCESPASRPLAVISEYKVERPADIRRAFMYCLNVRRCDFVPGLRGGNVWIGPTFFAGGHIVECAQTYTYLIIVG